MNGTTAPVLTARPTQIRFWRCYAVTMRPYLLFVSGITGIAGASLVSSVPTGPMVALGVVFFLAYGFGQALTDCFQTDTDSISSPYRPLVQGTVCAHDVLFVSLAGLIGCGAVLVVFSRETLLPAAASVLGLATYTWFKRRWWGGPWYNAWIVSLVVLLGYQAASGAAGAPAPVTPALIGMMIASLTGYANFVLTGYYKDIEADRTTGYNTLPVVFGRTTAAWVSDTLAALALVGAGIALRHTSILGIIAASPFLAGAAALSILAQTRLHAVQSDSESHQAIAPVVHAYILLLAGLAAGQQPGWSAGLALFYLAFIGVLSRRPMAAQI